jgi:hypothetical protein
MHSLMNDDSFMKALKQLSTLWHIIFKTKLSISMLTQILILTRGTQLFPTPLRIRTYPIRAQRYLGDDPIRSTQCQSPHSVQ